MSDVESARSNTETVSTLMTSDFIIFIYFLDHCDNMPFFSAFLVLCQIRSVCSSTE